MSDKGKILGITDIVLLTIVAILNIRQIPNAAPYGASSIMMWVLAAVGLFIPLALVCGELSTAWPEEGGMYVWVREAFGSRSGWLCAFFYIMCCVVFFPLTLQFLLTTVGYVVSPALASNQVYICIGSIILFWLITLLNMKGMNVTKIISNYGAVIGIFIPCGLIILLGLYWVLSGHPMATDYSTVSKWIPDFSKWSTIVFLSAMMYAFGGVEVASMVAGHVKNPQRDFPRAILIAGIIIAALYILATVGLNALFPAEDVNIVAGIMQAMEMAGKQLHMPWLMPLMGIMIGLGTFASINAWVVGPIYMLNKAASEGNILGKKFSEVDEAGTPRFALAVQAIIVTLFCLTSFLSPSAETAYWTLTAMATVLYFIPYLMMFMAYIKLKKSRPEVPRSFAINNKFAAIFWPVLGFISVLFALILVFIPPSNLETGSLFVYECKLIGGSLIWVVVADLLHKRAMKKMAAEKDLMAN